MTMAFEEVDLEPLTCALIERAAASADDANALMDLSTILLLRDLKEVGLRTQALALQTRRLYELPAERPGGLTLLAIMAPGDLMTNAPLAFLTQGSQVTLRMLYLLPGEPLPTQLPEHDLAYIAISESSASRGLLEQLHRAVGQWPRPVINAPAGIIATARTHAFELLANAPGVAIPVTAQATRAQLRAMALQSDALSALLPEFRFPLIVRPVDSHAGHDLERLDTPAQITGYLQATDADDYFVSPFIDYRSPDGLYRKYRVVLIDGVPHAGHMAMSAQWMIHYLNAGMGDSAAKRAEEAEFMLHFDDDFARRHREALATIARRFGLQYLVIDCAQAADGRLLVFEADPAAIVHAMDPVALFPYKRAPMQRVFQAFCAMLARHAKPA